MNNLVALARMWRARRPSGRFVLHRIPRNSWCQKHGRVTRYHFCDVTCSSCGFRCLPECSEL